MMSTLLEDLLAPLAPISLTHANEVAQLQTRVDRKYIVDENTLLGLAAALSPTSRVLEVDRCRSCDYQSTYFDTPDLFLFHAAVQGRRQRCKVRSRQYGESGPCFLEVKTKGQRGTNVKTRIRYSRSHVGEITEQADTFIAKTSGDSFLARSLVPVLDTTYSRTTIIDVATSSRLTIDAELRCVAREAIGSNALEKPGRTAVLNGYVVETKSEGGPSAADRWLWRRGVRPTKLSKFGTGLCVLRPDLPSNKWHRVISRHWTTAVQWSDEREHLAGQPARARYC